LLVCGDAQLQLGAGTHEDHFRRAVRITEHVRALPKPRGGRVLRAINRGQRLPAEYQRDRMMLRSHHDAPRFRNLM
jgi:hypothetical protein